MSTLRVIAYVDGFNLYFGLRSAGWRKYYWLNVENLAEGLLRKNESLARVKYFTARIDGDPKKKARQDAYLSALKTLNNTEVIYGQYFTESRRCKKCGDPYQHRQEKGTDVAIAANLLKDSFKDYLDVALLISGDADLVPALRIVRNDVKKNVFAVFPPNRHSNSIKKTSDEELVLGEKHLAGAQFPDEVVTSPPFSVRRPAKWR